MTQYSLEPLFDRAKKLLDYDEHLSADELEKAAGALIYFLVVPDPAAKLPLKQKLVLLWAIHKNLSVGQAKELDSENFSITRTLESGDYGIDIKDKLELGEGWQLLVEERTKNSYYLTCHHCLQSLRMSTLISTSSGTSSGTS